VSKLFFPNCRGARSWYGPVGQKTPTTVRKEIIVKVTVLVNGHVKCQGSISEISHKAEDVFAWLGFIAPLKPGSVMGFGTIPDCTGCDHDDFIDPGADIQIAFERLGTLRCRFAELTGQATAERLASAASVTKIPWVKCCQSSSASRVCASKKGGCP